MLKTPLSNLDSVNLHNPDRTVVTECMPLPGNEGSCLCLPCQFFYSLLCFCMLHLNFEPPNKVFPPCGLSDWLISSTKVTCSGCVVWTLMNGFSCASILLSHIISLNQLHSLCRPFVTSSSQSSSTKLHYLQICATITISSLCKHVHMLTSTKPLKKSWNAQNVEIFSCTLSCTLSFKESFNLKLGFLANKENLLQIKESIAMLWSVLLCAGPKMRCLHHVSWDFPEPRKASQSRVEEEGSNLLPTPTPLPLSSCRDSHSNVNTQIFLSTCILYSPLPRLFLLSW